VVLEKVRAWGDDLEGKRSPGYFGGGRVRRGERGKKRFGGVKHTVPVYPLIDMGWSREACVEYLRGRLPYEALKSLCVFCPYHSNQSWLHLKLTDAEGWSRAVEVDEALWADGSIVTRGFRQKLHHSCEPLVQVDFGSLAPNTLDPMTVGECLGQCGH
jgi:hypothetical protein